MGGRHGFSQMAFSRPLVEIMACWRVHDHEALSNMSPNSSAHPFTLPERRSSMYSWSFVKQSTGVSVLLP